MNGSNGIAVGMATNIPPHNLCELVDALNLLIDRYDEIDEVSVEELMQHVPGPTSPPAARSSAPRAFARHTARVAVT